MKFGYFFNGIRYDGSGHGAIEVQVRPMDESAQGMGLKVTLSTPFTNTPAHDGSMQGAVHHALQAAQQLLPESALTAWMRNFAGDGVPQPALPEGAREQWEGRFDPPAP